MNPIPAPPVAGRAIEHADALDWLAAHEPGTAKAIIFDPPYSRYSPMRGREDGAAGSVSAPFSFMHRVMGLCARAVQPKGIVIIFGDWKLLPDISYIASVCGLREHSHLAWIRSRPGGDGLFRGACDPVLIASRTPPDRVDKAAVKNWFQADYEIPRNHPYSKPPELIAYILAASAAPATSSSTRSPDQAAPGMLRRSWAWTWSGKAVMWMPRSPRSAMVEGKICTGCGLPKPLEEFSPRRDRPAGRKSRCKACLAAGAGASRKADPEKAREALRRSRAAAPSSRKKADSKTARRWRKANPEKVAASKRRAYAKLKARVFAHYGTACACCGATQNLSIDHVNGDGGDHREELFGRRNGGGEQIWRWLVRNGFPDGFQTFCIPCNQSKRTGKRCRLDHGCDIDPQFAETTPSATASTPATA